MLLQHYKVVGCGIELTLTQPHLTLHFENLVQRKISLKVLNSKRLKFLAPGTWWGGKEFFLRSIHFVNCYHKEGGRPGKVDSLFLITACVFWNYAIWTFIIMLQIMTHPFLISYWSCDLFCCLVLKIKSTCCTLSCTWVRISEMTLICLCLAVLVTPWTKQSFSLWLMTYCILVAPQWRNLILWTSLHVYVKEYSCFWPTIEKLYYSAGFEPICIYCASEMLKIVIVFIQNTLLVLKNHQLKRDLKDWPFWWGHNK